MSYGYPLPRAEVTLKVMNQLPALCSVNNGWVTTEWTGWAYADGEIQWESMKTLDPQVAATCEWYRGERSDSWDEVWLGVALDMLEERNTGPTALALPTNWYDYGMNEYGRFESSIAVLHKQTSLCSKNNIPVTTLWKGRECTCNLVPGCRCYGDPPIEYESMITLNPDPSFANDECDWFGGNFDPAWNAVWLGGCGVTPTFAGLSSGSMPTLPNTVGTTKAIAATCSADSECGNPEGCPFVCVNNVFLGSKCLECRTNTDCANGKYCFNNACYDAKPNGHPCTSNFQCQSSNCRFLFCFAPGQPW